mgnify:CR=1 FL=1
MRFPMRFSMPLLSIVAGALLLAGCGDGGGADEAEARPSSRAASDLSRPAWMSVDRDANSVEMEIVAGETESNDSWNYNGYSGGGARIIVPEGARVTIHFRNGDGVSPHSLAIVRPRDTYPGRFNGADPVFDGAVSDSPTSLEGATQPGASETISFTASESGDYVMMCYLPGHANGGHRIHFRVSGAGRAGFREL